MSTDDQAGRTNDRLDGVLAALRDRPASLDELTRARVAAKLAASLAAPEAAPAEPRGWTRRRTAVAIGLAAAAAVAVIAGAALRREPAQRDPAQGDPAERSAAAEPGAPGAAEPARAPKAAAVAPLDGARVPSVATAGTGARAASADPAPSANVQAPITVPAGESGQLELAGAAVTVYGPGRLAPTAAGAEVEATGLVVDRPRGDAPWSLRYHGVEVVVTRATFAMDRGSATRGVTRVTVLRGELVLRCPSGDRTIYSGMSATCERAPVAAIARSLPASLPAPAPAPAAQAGAAPAPEEHAAARYAFAEAAMRRHDEPAARAALLEVVAAAPESLDAATALFELARLAASRGDRDAALGYLDRVDQHPRRGALAAPAARLRASLVATTPAP